MLSSKKKKNESIEDKIKHVFDRLEGGFAVASISKSKPSELVLFRKDNPIELYYDSTDDILYFCSERGIMQEALEIAKSSKRGFNLGENNYHHYEMQNNHALIINTEGVDNYKKYFPKRESWYYRNNYSLVENLELFISKANAELVSVIPEQIKPNLKNIKNFIKMTTKVPDGVRVIEGKEEFSYVIKTEETNAGEKEAGIRTEQTGELRAVV